MLTKVSGLRYIKIILEVFIKWYYRLAQRTLAEQVTLLVHGEEGLQEAEKASKVLYEGSITALSNMKPDELQTLFTGASVVEILPEAGQTLLDLSMKVGCFPTQRELKSERNIFNTDTYFFVISEDALRIISAGGFYVNQQKIRNPSEVVNLNVHRLENNVSLLRVGKKNYYIVKWLS